MRPARPTLPSTVRATTSAGRRRWLAGGTALALTTLAGCATRGLDTGGYSGPAYEGPPRRETAHALTETGELLHLFAARPTYPDLRLQLTGAVGGEPLLALARHSARRQLVVLGRSGRVYAVNADTGALTALNRPLPAPLTGQRFAMDVDPADGQLRVFGDDGAWRGAPDGVLQPDAGAVRLDSLASARAADGRAVQRYGIATTGGQLLRLELGPQGLQAAPVGSLGLPPLARASLGVADGADQGLLMLQLASEPLINRLALVDLASGRARLLGLLPAPPQVLSLVAER
ncbi:DUF4394 domain-containing protein [Aquabacterium sp. J223]|uniref:DUF4394 domain-containing protein n=1 Tax=Aquabacterium sp. J223 TaxID=2898431 RepID=UPI0021ADAA10|nr:DUF4394 domain-containing protein [Aquabacterium sp. J223]UUX94905.1 DUF4394 domain-containing protein [Aquabacterium sp. J223]